MTDSQDVFEQLKLQIANAVSQYKGNDVARAAMLSGMSLTANYLAKLDGSKTITPAMVLKAVCDVGEDFGYAITRLK